MFKFDMRYFLPAVLLFISELIIALFVRDTIIRPYGGDFLVVILVYCTVKSFVNIPWLIVALGSLAFSFLVETLQYFNFIHLIGLGESAAAKVIMGNMFEWGDMFAYTLGTVLVIIIEYRRYKLK